MQNAFMESTRKNRREQADIEDAAKGTADPEELVAINIRIPKSLRDRVQMRRIKTGENMTQLIRRLLSEELDERSM